MKEDSTFRVRSAIARMPDWLRRDLSNKDESTRQRAEEALAAMVLNAMDEPVGR